MPPSPELSSLDYTPDNAAYIAHCMAQAAHWTHIRKALLSRGIKGRGLHLATSRIGVWMSKAARL
jgi:hypothetical protein